MAEDDGRIAKLKNVRAYYVDGIHEAKPTVEGGEPKHTCTFVLESDTAEFEVNKKAIIAALNATAEKQWKKVDAWKVIQEDDPKRLCFRRGERFKNKEGQVYAGFAGNMALAVAGPSGGKRRPVVLDRRKKKTELKDLPDVLYGGVYCDIIVSFYGTDKGGKGVFASVEVIRSRETGDRVGGGYQFREDDVSDFDDLEDDDDSFGDSFD